MLPDLPDAESGEGENTLLIADGVTVLRSRDPAGRTRLRWRGTSPWQPEGDGSSGMRAVFAAVVPAEDGMFDHAGLLPLEAVVPFPMDDVAAALSLSGRLCHLVADLHDAGHVYTRLDAATVWVDGDLERPALMPLAPLPENERITGAMRAALARTQRAIYRHPVTGEGRAALAERRLDLHALGVLCCQLLTGLPRPPDTLGFGVGPPPIALRIVARLMSDEAPRYETARGAALDFLECAAALRRSGTVAEFALGRQDGAPRLRMPADMVGRAAELECLRDAYLAARDRATGVYISGAPGVGKTRLIEELRRTVEACGACFAGGKFDQLRSDAPLTAVGELLDQIALHILGLPTRLQAAWAARLKAQLDSDAAVVLSLAPQFERLLGAMPPPLPLPPLEARNRFTFAILRLVRAVARPRHPLCLFLDDMQWTDDATLELIGAVNSDPTLRGVAFIGAYRDGEVDAAHPLAQTIEQQKLGNYPPTIIALSVLDRTDVAHFVATILRHAPAEVAPLAEALNAVAGGNPFFIGQLVRSLVTSGVVVYDFQQARWAWDDLDVAALEFDADVVSLVIGRLKYLTPACRRLLVHAAMLGRNVSEQTLRLATGLDADAVRGALEEAVGQGVLVRRFAAGAGDHAGQESHVFTHDRLQQAALELLPATETTAIRRATGLALLRSADTEGDPGLIALALSHVNDARDEVDDPATRLRLAQLNLEQGERAHDRLAFSNARERFEAGLRWLPADAWDRHRTLAMHLHTACFREACQTGDVERAEAVYATLMARVDGPVEAAGIVGIRVLADTAAKRYDDVWRHARTALRLLGERLPARATPLGLVREYLALRRLMGRRRVQDLAALPATDSDSNRRAIEVLASALPALYFIDPQLMMLCGMRITSLSIRKGTAPHSAIGFVIVGLGLASALERFAEGHDWGRVAEAMGDRSGNDGVRAKTRLIFGAFLNMWRESFASSHDLLVGAYQAAMRAGDHQYALYTINARAMSSFFEGRPLQSQRSEIRRTLPFVLQTQDPFAIESLAVWTDAIDQLTQGRANPAATAARLEKLEALGNPTVVGYQFCVEAHLDVMFERPEAALASAQAALARRTYLIGQLVLVEAEFAAGMAAAQLLADRSTRRLRRALAASLKRLRIRAANAPMNFTPHLRLLEAEAQALSRRPERALAHYEAAAEAAEAGGFAHVAALAARGAARTARRLGLSARVIETYDADMARHLRAWGAEALLGRAAEDAVAPPVATTNAGRLAEPGAVADALRRHDDGEARLQRVLRAAVEEAGADAAFFVALDGETPAVLAVATEAGDALIAGAGEPLSRYPAVLPEIVDLMREDGRERVIENMALDPRFAAPSTPDAPAAVLCVPPTEGRSPPGVLYLAAQTPRRFSGETRRAVRLAASEIAAGLARLEMGRALGANERALSHAARRIETLTQARARLATFLPQGVGADDGGQGAVAEREVTALFIDIQDYTVLVERHGAAMLDGLIERRFSRFYDEVAQRGGDFATTIGDAILAVFGDEPDGAPQTERAVQAALAVALAAREAAAGAPPHEPAIVVNIGIETGHAIARVAEFGTGATKRRAFSVVGASVNVASRIVGLARNGEVLIGETARAALPDAWPTRPRGAVALKNVATPVEVHEIALGAVGEVSQRRQTAD